MKRSKVQGNVIFQIPIYHLLHADEISIQALAVRNSFKLCYMALISLWPVDVSVDTEGEVRGQIWRDIINPYTTLSIYVDNKHHTYSYGLVLRFFLSTFDQYIIKVTLKNSVDGSLILMDVNITPLCTPSRYFRIIKNFLNYRVNRQNDWMTCKPYKKITSLVPIMMGSSRLLHSIVFSIHLDRKHSTGAYFKINNLINLMWFIFPHQKLLKQVNTVCLTAVKIVSRVNPDYFKCIASI